MNNRSRIFISWSGGLAESFAKAFKAAINDLAGEHADTFFSRDIEPGASWVSEILKNLNEAHYGIVIVTPESLRSPWVQFESGAIAMAAHHKQAQTSLLPLLVGVDERDQALTKSPFGSHQYKQFDPEDADLSVHYLDKLIEFVVTSKGLNYSDGWKNKVEARGRDLHEKLRQSYTEWIHGPKTHLPDVELVDYSSNASLFRDFTGEYTAFNAPLVFEEAGNNEDILQDHVKRYKTDKTKAEYFYPIFALLDQDGLIQWLHNVSGFFQRLSEELGEEEMSRLTFYVPKYSSQRFLYRPGYEMGFTFFAGEKRDESYLVYLYMHNGIYSDLATTKEPIVRKFFVIRKEADFWEHKNFIQRSRLRANANIRKLTLPQFLEYCETIIEDQTKA